MMLEKPVTALKGVGPGRASALLKLGVATMRDLIYFLPRGYEDYARATNISGIEHGAPTAIHARVLDAPKIAYVRAGMTVVSATAQDDTGAIQLVWYNQPFRQKQVKRNETLYYCGRADTSRGKKLVGATAYPALPGILPVYPLVSGLNQKALRESVQAALSLCLPEIKETLPPGIRSAHGLMDISAALKCLHAPKAAEELQKARYRLAFEDMLTYLLAIGFLKRERRTKKGIPFQTQGLYETYTASLPFALTGAQERVLREIAADMAQDEPMNRLVQGDVGAGKTVLAFFALYIAVQNGFQAALMAPTEVLAKQHYERLHAQYGEQTVLLSGSMRKKEKDLAYARIANGEAKYIVGTHALLQEALVFHNIGAVVADEQHRFGVRQRARLAQKSGVSPDVLIMSATPIPRTLSMLLYGDLSLSTLNELPPGRKEIRTHLVPANKRTDMYAFIYERMKQGQQAYVVCPLVEQSEVMDVKSAQEVHEELMAQFPDLPIELLHGRLKSAEKDERIASFRRGETAMLVSTTVVEVGVDVQNASVMVIEDADRFGLAQLHQLRGRVGRGEEQSYCFLLCGAKSDTAMERMKIMAQTNDGFAIANRDLELRGPGEFLGTRQHGDEGLRFAKMAGNMDVLMQAQKAADDVFAHYAQPDCAQVVDNAYALYCKRMREIAEN